MIFIYSINKHLTPSHQSSGSSGRVLQIDDNMCITRYIHPWYARALLPKCRILLGSSKGHTTSPGICIFQNSFSRIQILVYKCGTHKEAGPCLLQMLISNTVHMPCVGRSKWEKVDANAKVGLRPAVAAFLCQATVLGGAARGCGGLQQDEALLGYSCRTGAGQRLHI